MSHVWDSLKIDPSKDPTINTFKNLQDNWSKINCNDMSSLYQPIDVAAGQLIELYKRSIGADFLREDYLYKSRVIN